MKYSINRKEKYKKTDMYGNTLPDYFLNGLVDATSFLFKKMTYKERLNNLKKGDSEGRESSTQLSYQMGGTIVILAYTAAIATAPLVVGGVTLASNTINFLCSKGSKNLDNIIEGLLDTGGQNK